MIGIFFLFLLAGIWILLASVQDINEREVDNWLSYSLIIFAFGFRFFYSWFMLDFSLGVSLEDFWFFYQGIFGLGIFFILGNLFYYSRVFAGGDAKLLFALGAVIPIFNSFVDNLRLMFVFILFLFVVGAIYSLIGSFYFSFRNFKNFKLEFKKLLIKNKKSFVFGNLIALLILLMGFYEGFFIIFGILILVFVWLLIYSKAIEESAMVKELGVGKLREGDWLYKDVVVNGRKIKATWDGLTKKDIQLIQKHKKNIKIKEGVPFVPVFLIAFILFFILLWNSSWEPEFFNTLLGFFENFF